MSYKDLIKKEYKENQNNFFVNKVFIERALLDSIISDDKKNFSNILNSYYKKIDIYNNLVYQNLQLSKDDGIFNDGKEVYSIEEEEKFKTNIVMAAFSHDDSYYARKLLEKFNLFNNMDFVDNANDLFVSKNNFIHMLNLFNDDDENQKKIFLMGFADSLLTRSTLDTRFSNNNHVDRLIFIGNCLESDSSLIEECSKYCLDKNKSYNFEKLKSIMNLTFRFGFSYHEGLIEPLKKILSLLSDDLKIKILIDVTKVSTMNGFEEKERSESSEIKFIKNSRINIIRNGFYDVLTNVKDFNELALNNLLLKTIVVHQNNTKKNITEGEIKDQLLKLKENNLSNGIKKPKM